MDMITDMGSVCFGLFLVALFLIPNLIAIYFGYRAQKRHGAHQTASTVLAAYPAPVPFNYPRLVLRETDGPRREETREEEDPADWWKVERPDHA